jgi:hypothetical protein
MIIATVINPDNLSIKEVLINRGKAYVLPHNARVMWADNKTCMAVPHIEVDGKEYKLCPKCGKWQRLFEYYKSRNFYDGLHCYCADCQLEEHRKRGKMKRYAEFI